MNSAQRTTFLRRAGVTMFSFVAQTLTALGLGTVITVLVVAVAGIVVPKQVSNNTFVGDILMWCVTFAVGFGLGYCINRIAHGRVACWVWVPGLIWVTYAIRDWVRHYDPRWFQGCSAAQDVLNAFLILDSSKCGGGEEGLNAVFFTLPAFCSIAYSIGAWIALRVGRNRRKTAPSVRFT
jgi:hypothetical protein